MPLQTPNEFNNRMKELENSLKAFIDMESMISEEIANALELLFSRFDSLQKQLEEYTARTYKTGESAEDLSAREASFSSQNCYNLQAFFNRQDFLSFQLHLAQQQKEGEGVLFLTPSPLYIKYYEGNVYNLEMGCLHLVPTLKACDKKLSELRLQNWQNSPKEDLIPILAEMMQGKTKYLAGISSVLQKVPQEQLLKKLQVNAPPFLQRNKTGKYNGEALFHFVLESWAETGEAYIEFKFSEKTVNAVKTWKSMPVQSLINRARALGILSQTGNGERQ